MAVRKQLYTHRKFYRTPDGQGGYRKVWYDRQTVRGTISLKSLTFQIQAAGDNFVAGQKRVRVSHIGYGFSIGYGIAKGHQVVKSDGTYFTVQSVRLPGDRGTTNELQLLEYQYEE